MVSIVTDQTAIKIAQNSNLRKYKRIDVKFCLKQLKINIEKLQLKFCEKYTRPLRTKV